MRVLRAVARYYGLTFQMTRQEFIRRDCDVFVEYMSRLDFGKLPECVGSHMIRDPRDIIISGYFYHLWTKEEWALVPRSELGNISYQQYLNGMNKEEGLLAEMEGTSHEVLTEMAKWDYGNSQIYEIKYEEMILDEEKVFREMFKHYGFHEDAVNIAVGIADKFSFKNKSKRKFKLSKGKSHLRSGRAKQWESIFEDVHKQRFKELYGDLLIKLGYEENNDW